MTTPVFDREKPRKASSAGHTDQVPASAFAFNDERPARVSAADALLTRLAKYVVAVVVGYDLFLVHLAHHQLCLYQDGGAAGRAGGGVPPAGGRHTPAGVVLARLTRQADGSDVRVLDKINSSIESDQGDVANAVKSYTYGFAMIIDCLPVPPKIVWVFDHLLHPQHQHLVAAALLRHLPHRKVVLAQTHLGPSVDRAVGRRHHPLPTTVQHQ